MHLAVLTTKLTFHPQHVPSPLLPYDRAKAAFQELGDDDLPMDIVAMSPGDEVALGGGVFVSAFATCHRVTSQGYMIRDRRPRGLKPEYQVCLEQRLIEVAVVQHAGFCTCAACMCDGQRAVVVLALSSLRLQMLLYAGCTLQCAPLCWHSMV